MKKVISTVLLFLGVELSLWFLSASALGLSMTELFRQESLPTLVGGFGFLLTALLLLLFRFLRLPEVNQAKASRWLLSFLFPAASAVLVGVMIYTVKDISRVSVAALVFIAVLVVANGAIFFLLRMMERQAKEERERALLRQQMDIQIESILSLEKSYRAQREATHEFRNQLQTIHDLLARDAKDEAIRYIEQLQGMQTTRVFAVNTHHPILDAVLNQKYQAAKEQDIEFQFRVNDLSGLKLETDALVVLFSNLLDNAIEGCRKLTAGRMIQCTVLASDNLFISIRNASPPVLIVGNEIPTTKEPKQAHGFGLVSVRRILDDLGAEYTFNYADGWFEFAAEIPL